LNKSIKKALYFVEDERWTNIQSSQKNK